MWAENSTENKDLSEREGENSGELKKIFFFQSFFFVWKGNVSERKSSGLINFGWDKEKTAKPWIDDDKWVHEQFEGLPVIFTFFLTEHTNEFGSKL